ncbi:hypothetical protein ACHWQZ_G013456 [Mnemiopsis leidyi]
MRPGTTYFAIFLFNLLAITTAYQYYDPCRQTGTDFNGGDGLPKIDPPITEEECVNKCLEEPLCTAVTHVNPNPDQYGSGLEGCYLKAGSSWTENSGVFEANMVSVDISCIRNKLWCTLPASSDNSQYTVNGVAQGDGINVAYGTAFTLLCDQGYNTVQTCTSDLATSDIFNECYGKLSIGLDYSSTSSGDFTVDITQANSNLAVNNIANDMSRYKIDGNALWEFYDDVNFNGELLFIARGPIGWTEVDEAHNDKVESVRPSLVWCTLPASSENSQYTVNGVAKGDGGIVAGGTAITLQCDSGYTFQNTKAPVQTCTSGLATSDIINMCFDYEACRYTGTDFLGGGGLPKIYPPITEEECVNKCLEEPLCTAVTYVYPNPDQYDSTVEGCHLKQGSSWTVNSGPYEANMVSVKINCIRNKLWCTLPASSENSQYTVNGVSQDDGTNVAHGTAFTLQCDSEYTFKNINTWVKTCSSDLATSDIKNECFQVTTSPDEAEYKFLGETATITCAGAAKINPFLVEVRQPYPNGLSVALVSGSDIYDEENDLESPQFEVTSSDTPGEFSLSCDMQVFNDVSEKEQSSDSVPIVFIKTIAPIESENGEVGSAFSIAAKVSKNDVSSYSISWTKNGNVYSTNQNSEETESGVTYIVSTVSITDLALDDAGTYVASVIISDSSGNQKLTKTFSTVLAIRGFSKHPQTATGATSLTQNAGSTTTLTCAFQGTVELTELYTWTEDGSIIDLNNDANFVVTPLTVGGLEYRTLEIKSWPADWIYKTLKCKVMKTSDQTVLYESDAISLITTKFDDCRFPGTDFNGGDGHSKINPPITEEECVNKCLEEPLCTAVTHVNPNPDQYDSGLEGCYLKQGASWTENSGPFEANMVSVDVSCIRNQLQCTTVTVENAQISGATQPASYGQTLTVTCNNGYTLVGNSELTCDGTDFGTLPTCELKQCAAVTVENAQITPAQPVNYGVKITVTCNNGYTLVGNSELTCDGTDFGTLPTCELKQCAAVTVVNAQITPAQPVDYGVKITVTCNNGYTLVGNSELTCDGTDFGTLPTCELKQCAAVTVENAQITPAQPVDYGVKITVTCNNGYTLVGNSELTCDGTDFGTLPTCELKQCAAVTVENAQITPAQPVDYGVKITVTCNNGYTLVGNSELTCDGTDFGTLPTCELKQCAAVTVENAQITPAQPVDYGVKITVTCNNGYTLVGNSELTCDGTDFGTLPTCELKQCAAVTVVNAQITPAQPVDYGVKITVTCNNGYTLVGNSELTCDGTDFGTLPTCQLKQCAAVTVENAQITPAQPVDYGVKITVTCNNGYSLVGNSELTCDGTDFGTLPTCELKQCAAVTVENAQITPAQPVDYGVKITVTCNNGYTLVGNSELTCDGTDFGTLPTCELKQCAAVTVENAQITPAQPVDYGVKITVTCNNGYTLVGNSELTCDGTDFGTLPTCELKQCAAVTVENAQITPAQPVDYGVKITVTCNNGYTLVGNSELTCDGTDFGTLPTCELKQCAAVTVENAQITPAQPVNHGVTITVTCNNGYVISGDSELLCEGSTFKSATPACVLPQCPVIAVSNAEITGDTQPTTTGQVITVTCNEGTELAGSSTLTCTGISFDNETPTCNTCDEVKVPNSILTPNKETSTVEVECINNGYELVGESSLSCEVCEENYKADTVMCLSPTLGERTLPECRLKPGACPGGQYYTTDGCVTCPAGSWIVGGDNPESGFDGCNRCPGVTTSSEGSTSEADCHYSTCSCKMAESAAADGKYKVFCSCL